MLSPPYTVKCASLLRLCQHAKGERRTRRQIEPSQPIVGIVPSVRVYLGKIANGRREPGQNYIPQRPTWRIVQRQLWCHVSDSSFAFEKRNTRLSAQTQHLEVDNITLRMITEQ